jgi:hypothetical protein
MISEKFKIAVKLDPRQQYKLAWMAGVNPTVLSQIITGYIRPKPGDPRVIKVGKILGIPAEDCFQEEVR